MIRPILSFERMTARRSRPHVYKLECLTPESGHHVKVDTINQYAVDHEWPPVMIAVTLPGGWMIWCAVSRQRGLVGSIVSHGEWGQKRRRRAQRSRGRRSTGRTTTGASLFRRRERERNVGVREDALHVRSVRKAVGLDDLHDLATPSSHWRTSFLKREHIAQQHPAMSTLREVLGRNCAVIEQSHNEWPGETEKVGRLGRAEGHLRRHHGHGVPLSKLARRRLEDLQ